MYVELRKVGFVNKGAELMLHAMMQKIKENVEDAKLVMAPAQVGPSTHYANRSVLGLYQKAWLWRAGIQLGDMAAVMPKVLRDMYGVVLDKEIDIVLDSAGFSYSDQWGPGPSEELARASVRWRKQGTKVILLPQAFGPFTSERIKKAVRKFVDNVDLIYAREEASYQHLVEVVGQRPHIKLAGDFTNLVEGDLPEYFDTKSMKTCIIPNYRMIDKTDFMQRKNYLPFMTLVTERLLERGCKPFIMIHEEKNDMKLARHIANEVPGTPIVTESNPLKIKGILGSCDAVVGSRFHGLVSALSQGVPSLATGWSHKYQMLFQDYGFKAGIIDLKDPKSNLDEKLDFLTDPHKRLELSKILEVSSLKLKDKSRQLWRDVFEELKI